MEREKKTVSNAIQNERIEAQVRIKNLVGINNIKVLKRIKVISKCEVKTITVNTKGDESTVKATICINERYVQYETPSMCASCVDDAINDLYSNTRKYAEMMLEAIK